MAQSIGVLIYDLNEACRRAMAGLVAEAGNGLSLVGETADEEEAVRRARDASPAVVFLSLRGPEEYGLIARLREGAPEARILVQAAREDGEAVFEAIRAGSSGFLTQRATPEEIVEALLRIASGDLAVEPAASTAGLEWIARRLGAADTPARLTRREVEILDLLSEGLSASGIAGRLWLSRRTVESHLANIYRKLGARNRMEAVFSFNREERRGRGDGGLRRGRRRDDVVWAAGPASATSAR